MQGGKEVTIKFEAKSSDGSSWSILECTSLDDIQMQNLNKIDIMENATFLSKLKCAVQILEEARSTKMITEKLPIRGLKQTVESAEVIPGKVLSDISSYEYVESEGEPENSREEQVSNSSSFEVIKTESTKPRKINLAPKFNAGDASDETLNNSKEKHSNLPKSSEWETIVTREIQSNVDTTNCDSKKSSEEINHELERHPKLNADDAPNENLHKSNEKNNNFPESSEWGTTITQEIQSKVETTNFDSKKSSEEINDEIETLKTLPKLNGDDAPNETLHKSTESSEWGTKVQREIQSKVETTYLDSQKSSEEINDEIEPLKTLQKFNAGDASAETLHKSNEKHNNLPKYSVWGTTVTREIQSNVETTNCNSKKTSEEINNEFETLKTHPQTGFFNPGQHKPRSIRGKQGKAPRNIGKRRWLTQKANARGSRIDEDGKERH